MTRWHYIERLPESTAGDIMFMTCQGDVKTLPAGWTRVKPSLRQRLLVKLGFRKPTTTAWKIRT